MALPPPQIANFEIVRQLGRGGMAEVFLARRAGAEGTFKSLVLKRILPEFASSRSFRTMFVEEALLATRLNHPNVVQVYEFSDHGADGLLLSMEFIDGCDLSRLVSSVRATGATIPPFAAAFVAAEAAKGLHYAHERRDEGGRPLEIVHRDVSPHNILLSWDGVVKIADFGIASANLFRDEAGTLKGKFAYMSPEQARGVRVDRRSDVFSLGVVLYELLCLASPYATDLDDDALLEQVRSASFERPSSRASVPRPLEDIVLRAMAKSPADRFATCREMATALARAIVAEGEVIDSAALESLLGTILPRGGEVEPNAASTTSGGGTTRGQLTHAAVRGARQRTGDAQTSTAPKLPREVRHVAVLTLRLSGMSDLASLLGAAAVHRVDASLREALDNVAFKRGAVWSWEQGQARAVVGLLANPARAAEDASNLAVDIHDALEGMSDDLPAPIGASISVVRGIAQGGRDERGHLVDHQLDDPAFSLADALASVTPLHRTWVAGGIYRQVRREFRWGDAPPLQVSSRGGAGPSSARMRAYELIRPLTKDERMTELAHASSDVVGRAPERADLLAAYHGAVSSDPSRASLRAGQASSVPPASVAPTTNPAPPPDAPASHQPSARPGDLSRAAPPRRASEPPPSAMRGELTARCVIGELGIGKTTLVRAFLNELPLSARKAVVECSPVRADLPYSTVSAVLRELLGLPDDAPPATVVEAVSAVLGAHRPAHVHRIAGKVAALLTGGRAADDDDAPHAQRDGLVLALRVLLGSLARTQPLVLVVDGVQWADRPSLDILRDLLRRYEQVPILVVLVTRPDERVTPYLEDTVQIELRGLSPEEQIRLVQTRWGVRDGVASVCSELVPRVAGNPFFLIEMVEALLERGELEIIDQQSGELRLERHDRGGDEGNSLPTTLEQLIANRIAELPSEERHVVDWLAVAGGPLTLSDLASLCGPAAADAASRLCARGVCDRKGESIDYRHPLARDVAYLALSPGSRVRMHRRLGEHLADGPLAQGASAALVARHLVRGEWPDRAADLYLEAASSARASHHVLQAERSYLRALALLAPHDPRAFDAHEALEAIYRQLGRHDERAHHLRALARLARDFARARWASIALGRAARLELDENRPASAIPVGQRAAELGRLAKVPALEVEAQLCVVDALRELGDAQGALRACDRALTVAQSGELSPRVRGEVLRTRGVLLRYVGRVREAVESHAEALGAFVATGARRSEARARNALAFAMLVLERFEDAIALAMSSFAIDAAMGARFQVAKTLSNIGQAYMRLGDGERGMSYLRSARERHERHGDLDSQTDTLLSCASACLELGDSASALDFANEATARVESSGNLYDRIHERVVRALLGLATEDWAHALQHAAEARRLAEARGIFALHSYATAIEGQARVKLGELESGWLLAQAALGAVEAAEACEFGLEVRGLAASALEHASPAAALDANQRAAAHVHAVLDNVRDPAHQRRFLDRRIVRHVLEREGRHPASAPVFLRARTPPGGRE